MKRKGILIAYLSTFLLLFSCKDSTKKSGSQNAKAEPYQLRQTLYYGGNIITMEGDQPQYAEAVVQREGKIVFVGSKEEAFNQFKEKADEVDLQGKTMVPAFVDGHGHFYNTGFASIVANLLPPPDGPCGSIQEVVDATNKWKETEDGKFVLNKFGWIIGHGYDDSQLTEKDHPKATDLDKISEDIPVLLIHQSEHLGVMNSKALELSGYTKDAKDPEGGHLRRNPDGSPNGVLEEKAMYNILFPLLGKADEEFAMKCIEKSQEQYAQNGYLTIQDGRTTAAQSKILNKAATKGKFYLDIISYPDIDEQGFTMDEEYYNKNQYKNHYRVGGVKLTLDGSPQGKTAWLTQCYHVNPVGKDGCYKGFPIMNDEKAKQYVDQAFQNQWQIICHTNGDAAIDQYLMAIADAEEKYGYPDHRTTIIHGQTLRKDQIPMVKELDVYCSLFPTHTFYWGDWHRESVLGEPRADYISPCRDVIDAGINLTSHHDAPVIFPNSMRVYDATVNRVTRTGYVLGPDQRVTPYEGLKTLTIWGAKQNFEENTKGSISEGKLADLVILDKNPLKIDPMDIHNIQVLESIKEGKTVYSKEKK
ncbi:amidohydrolase [Muricauda sp. CAU 1633]|uniref:amidohydrolase n=1 Tax=Allomuricauda sp. CAU 1633 TaxID=2816036 RepID=UPI001A8E275E|nr:amidohydrolase [Muricauda sp. CAU 1633]MBO0322273.1 amidohydrolase [Muricauda sp. CAU 1633]